MKRHSAILWATISLMLVHLSHCNTNAGAGNLDHIDGTTGIGFDLGSDHESSLQSLSSSSSKWFNEEGEMMAGIRSNLLRSILRNAIIDLRRYLTFIDATPNRDVSAVDDTTAGDARVSGMDALPSNGKAVQDGGDVVSLPKRGSVQQHAPLRKRQLNAIERAVIRQEILRRLEESKNPMEIPIGLRFRRAHGNGGFSSHYPIVPFVDSFFPSYHPLGSFSTRHLSLNSFLDRPVLRY
ncbi:uncharacterized protein LOC121428374 [Lytechinus variegatus]|uniref:uncharacterized protein LOC121428374 n=1 Tax=Lytechinus variegatus TaxID=7654 RepID=UPI001BB216DA|nr:uncharacterized protein LOC121428374 [Lytechinus variegatus]